MFYGVTLAAVYFSEISGANYPLVLYLSGDVTDPTLHTVGKDSPLQILAFGIHVAAAAIFYLYLTESRLPQRVVYLVLAGLPIVIGVLKASKTDIVIPLLTYAAIYYYNQKLLGSDKACSRQPFRKLLCNVGIICAACSILIVFVMITAVRLYGSGHSETYAEIIDLRYVDEMGRLPSEAIALLYGYTALGFQNFSNVMSAHEVTLRLGTSLLRPVLSSLKMGDLADSMSVPVDQWNVVSGAANTGTFLTPLYLEGGVYFCVLGSLLYGLFVNCVYYIAIRQRATIRWLFLYIVLIYPWVWLFFANAFSVLSIYINFAYAILLTLSCVTSVRDISDCRAPRVPIGGQ